VDQGSKQQKRRITLNGRGASALMGEMVTPSPKVVQEERWWLEEEKEIAVYDMTTQMTKHIMTDMLRSGITDV